MCGWFDGSVGQRVESGQITKNLIHHDLIEIPSMYKSVVTRVILFLPSIIERQAVNHLRFLLAVRTFMSVG